jgi:hypothetical protein
MPDKIILDQGGMLGRVIIDDHSIVAAFKMRVRFNRRIEVLDPNGSVQTTIDIEKKCGALAPLWKLTEVTDVARVEMDENAFRIRLSDGSVIRSQNIMDVRQPDLAQVEFWTSATAYDDAEPAPGQVKRYPAILAAQ